VVGVGSVGSYRRLPLDLLGWPTQLIVLNPTPEIQSAYRFKSARPEGPWTAFESGTGLMISEPLAYRHGLRVNDLLDLPTPEGTLSLPITGVFYDYGSEHGMVLIHESIYRRYWPDPAMASLGIYADTPDLTALTRRIETAVADLQPVSITPSRAIREQSMAIFDRTFTITNVLRALAVLVAFVGVVSALMAMLLDRSREFAVLRANGLTPAELGGLMSLETLFLGASAGLLAIPTGLMLAWVLIFVINRRAFGWTMQFQVDPGIVFQAVVLAVIAAILAGLYPAWRLARTPPSVVLRSD
jgi:putative ABC transport system permease protein